MSPLQRKIFSEAPKFRFYSCGSIRKKELIPDSCKSRQWALRQGATHFSTFAFNRLDGRGLATVGRWGDFYFRIADQERTHRRIKEALRGIVDVILRIDASSVKVTYLGSQTTGITLPQSYFDRTNGMPCRRDHYWALARIFRQWFEGPHPKSLPFDRTGLRFHYSEWMDADNRALSSGGYAVPMSLDEYFYLSEMGLRRRTATPSDLNDLRCEQLIPFHLKEAIRHASKKNALRTDSPPRDWLPIVPLISPSGASGCNVNCSVSGIKCAIKLIAWCRSNKVYEFSQRNALQAVDGTFTRDHGVSEGLAILQSHGYLRECAFPKLSYPGRRPRWFVVNPSAFI